MADRQNLEEKKILRLVRHVAGRRLAVAVEGDMIRLSGRKPDEVSCFSKAVLDKAGARGLLVVDGATVEATPAASAYLRRALPGPDEAYQDQHRDIAAGSVIVDGARQPVRINQTESPLGGLARLKDKAGGAFLPAEAVAAGERLHADFTRAQLQPRLTMAYEPRLSAKTKGMAGGTADLCDTAIAARLRVARAMEAVGPELSGVALDVCCFEKGLETVERERQWPVRSAKLMLRTALLALSRHYAPPRRGAGGVRAWGDDGFRPEAGNVELGIRPPGAAPPRP